MMMIKRDRKAGKTRGAVRAFKLVRLNGTRYADFIRAGGHLHRANRPDT